MLPGTSVRRAAQVTCAALVLLLWVQPSPAQDVTQPALRAAYIYNIATFTRWPAEALTTAGPTVMCVVADEPIAGALEKTVRGRLHGGHGVRVARVTPTGPLTGCHLVYMSHLSASQAAPILARVRDLPVLTVSDLEGFGDLGGVVRFYFDRGRLRFDVNIKAAKSARLEFSAKLLNLAK